MIGGYLALPLNGVPGVGLVPRASGTANYIRNNGARHSLTGTIGLPNTQGQSTSDGAIGSPSGREWCLPPAMTASDPYYSSSGARSATLAGTWALVADGTQQQGIGTVPPMYFGSYAAAFAGDRWVQILPSSINLRISTLECTVNTPLDINFGSVNHDATVNAELGSRSYPLITTCGQPSNHINANINLQFRAASGIHASATTRLALNEGGGFVTGEINKGVTGSGACSGSTGIPFNNTPLKIGNITNVESSKTLDNQVTWRLCSGGNDMPIGKVTASAEMLVTFN
ncbi:adhesin [Enterobacterales bacterium CwR94]|nr:adhesin [Enterobacterales bacterium CwR94]